MNVDMDVHSLVAEITSVVERQTEKELDVVDYRGANRNETKELEQRSEEKMSSEDSIVQTRSAGQETTERCENAGEPKRKGEPKKRKEKPDDHLKRLVQEHDEHTMQEILTRIERLKSQGREEETRGQRFKRHLQEYNEKKENQKKTSEKPAEKIPAPEEQVREKIPPPPPAVVRNRLVAPPPPTPRRPPPPSFKDDWHNWFANSVCTSTRNRCPTDGSADDAAPPPPADQQSPPSPVPPPPDRLPAPAAVQTGHSSTDVLQSTISTLELTANANVLLTTMLWGMQPPIQQSLPIPMLPYIPAPPFVPAPPLHYNPIASHASRPTTQTSEPFRPERSEQSRKEYAKEAKKGRRYRNQKNRDGSP